MKTVKKEVVNPSKLAELYNEAIEIVENRHGFYGDFSKSLGTISEFWSTFLISRGLLIKNLTNSDTATMLSLFKVARTANGFQDKDTFVDACNYFMQAYLNKDVKTVTEHLTSSVNILMEREKKLTKSTKMVEKISKAIGRDITDERDFQNFCKEIIDILSTKTFNNHKVTLKDMKERYGDARNNDVHLQAALKEYDNVGNNGNNSTNVE